MKIKSSPNGEITLSFTDISKSCPSHNIFTLQICLKAILKNKILANISAFTVPLPVLLSKIKNIEKIQVWAAFLTIMAIILK